MLTFSRQVNSKTPSGAILKLLPTGFTTGPVLTFRVPTGRFDYSGLYFLVIERFD